MTFPCVLLFLGGRCVSNSTSAHCECPIGFVGLFCDIKGPTCDFFQPCLNGGTCQSISTNYSFYYYDQYDDVSTEDLLNAYYELLNKSAIDDTDSSRVSNME